MRPDGWSHGTLGDIADIGTGGTPDRAQPAYWGGDVPWVTTGEIQFNTITATAENITQLGLRHSSARLYPPGTLLMAMYGQGRTRGQVARLAIAACTNQNSAAIVFHEGFDPDFYFHFLSWQYEAIRGQGQSGGISHLNVSLVRRIVVPLAPLPEQRHIAAILGTWDAAISAADRLVDIGQRHRSLLADTLLTGPGDAGGAATWPRQPIGELIRESRIPGSGGDQARKLTVRLYGKGVVARDEKRPGSQATRYYRRSAGQFIYSKLDCLNGAFGLIPAQLDGYESTLDLPAFDFMPGVEPAWFVNHVARETFYSRLTGLARGGRKARRVSPDDLLRVRIAVPPAAQQQAMARVLQLADQQIATSARQAQQLRDEKSALMADLFTGRRRARPGAGVAAPAQARHIVS